MQVGAPTLDAVISGLDSVVAGVADARAVDAPWLFGRRAVAHQVRAQLSDLASTAHDLGASVDSLGIAGASDARLAIDDLARELDDAASGRSPLTARNATSLMTAQASARGVLELLRGVRAGSSDAFDQRGATTRIAELVAQPDELVTVEHLRAVDDLDALPEALRPDMPRPMTTGGSMVTRGRRSVFDAGPGPQVSGTVADRMHRELELLRAWVVDTGTADHVVAARVAAGDPVEPSLLARIGERGSDELQELGITHDDLARLARRHLSGLESTSDARRIVAVDSMRSLLDDLPEVDVERSLVDRASLLLMRTRQRMAGRVPGDTLAATTTRPATGHHYPDHAEIGRAGADIDLLLALRATRRNAASAAPPASGASPDRLTW